MVADVDVVVVGVVGVVVAVFVVKVGIGVSNPIVAIPSIPPTQSEWGNDDDSAVKKGYKEEYDKDYGLVIIVQSSLR